MGTFTIDQIGITRTAADIDDNDLFEGQIKDGGANNLKSFKITKSELFKAMNGGALQYKALISQNSPIASTNSGTMLAGQIWELSGAANPSDYAFFDTYELVSGTLYAAGSKYRVSVDTAFTFSASAIEYDGSPYIVSTDANGDFNPFVNTLGEDVIFSYDGVGNYFATITSSLFLKSKTTHNISQIVYHQTTQRIDDNNLYIFCFGNDSVTPVDNQLFYNEFSIKVYP